MSTLDSGIFIAHLSMPVDRNALCTRYTFTSYCESALFVTSTFVRVPRLTSARDYLCEKSVLDGLSYCYGNTTRSYTIWYGNLTKNSGINSGKLQNDRAIEFDSCTISDNHRSFSTHNHAVMVQSGWICSFEWTLWSGSTFLTFTGSQRRGRPATTIHKWWIRPIRHKVVHLIFFIVVII
jgi:hypothetical protein